MPDSTQDTEAITAANRMSDALEELGTGLKAAKVYGKRSRHLIWGLIFSLCLDVALTIGLTVGLFQVRAASNTAKVASQANVNLCLSSNVARAQQVGLWEYLISLGSAPRTAKQKALIGKFEHHLLVVYAPRNCNAINPKTSGNNNG